VDLHTVLDHLQQFLVWRKSPWYPLCRKLGWA